MKEYAEAKKLLQRALRSQQQLKSTRNALSLMYEFGTVCYQMKDYENAEKTLQSVLSQNCKGLMDGAYAHLIKIYRDKIKNVAEDGKDKEMKNECEKYLNAWIE